MKYKYRYHKLINGTLVDIKAKSPEELIRKISDKKAELGMAEKDLTVPELVDRWLSLKTVSVKTYKEYEVYARKIYGQLDIKVTDVRLSDLQQLINEERDKSAAFYKKYTTIITSVFQLAVDDRIITFNPAAKLKRPAGYYNGHRALTDTERDVFLMACKNKRYGNAFLLMYYCGLRNSEVVALKSKDVKNGVIHVQGGKTDNAKRDVPVPDVLGLDLKKEYVITSEKGKPVSTRTMRRWFDGLKREMNRIILEKGIDGLGTPVFYRNKLVNDVITFTAYSLRHTYCTNLEKMGVPINVAKRLMGHSSILITSKIYTHQSDEAFNDAKSKINGFNS